MKYALLAIVAVVFLGGKAYNYVVDKIDHIDIAINSKIDTRINFKQEQMLAAMEEKVNALSKKLAQVQGQLAKAKAKPSRAYVFVDGSSASVHYTENLIRSGLSVAVGDDDEREINIIESKSLAGVWRVTSYPTTVFLDSGEIEQGVLTTQYIKAKLKNDTPD